ncbi:UxaA family hydrolase [Hymenobacter coccineus]|uniref:UxaA family hydrolase n=1 Tax=Hymenobacter coccineus TaxID=1908235 RepID=UPI000A7E3324|nr:UxaA family hydrolase [Hymenobacter coccineus]
MSPSSLPALHTYLQIHPADNVLVALQDLPAGTALAHQGRVIRLPGPVAAKHKVTTEALAIGAPVRMYGVRVGKATQPIALGGVISTENVRHEAEPYSLDRRQAWTWQPPDVSAWQNTTFQGYPRADGSVGTRNYWLVVPLVFCENRNIRMMQDAFERALGYGKTDRYRQQVQHLADAYRDGRLGEPTDAAAEPAAAEAPAGRSALFPNVDGIKFLTHEMGCGGTAADAQRLCDLLAGFITNPNVGGVTVLSLGCQKTQMDMVQAAIDARAPNFDRPVLYFNHQSFAPKPSC